ncbi:MAG: hypothetical protein AB7N65_00990 [Vicinamibacterales bacterium]
MTARPQEVTAAVERLRLALNGMAAALGSGDLAQVLAAQEALLAAQIPSDTLRGWPDDARADLRTALRRARATLNGCRRTNHILLKVIDDFLTGPEADYTRHGALAGDAAHPSIQARLSCRV